ncbi:MAG: hypothetical protein ACXVAW_13335 [Vulcanimicrobiaceae bacterium]
MRISLEALALLAIACLAVSGMAQAQGVPCTASYVLAPATGAAIAPAQRIPCATRADQPLRLGDLTPAHSRDLSAQCNRACETARLVNDSDPQVTGSCNALAPPPAYERMTIIEHVSSTGCQSSTGEIRAVHAPPFIAPVRTLNNDLPRRSPPSAQSASPVHPPMPVHVPIRTMPAVQHGGASRIPH